MYFLKNVGFAGMNLLWLGYPRYYWYSIAGFLRDLRGIAAGFFCGVSGGEVVADRILTAYQLLQANDDDSHRLYFCLYISHISRIYAVAM